MTPKSVFAAALCCGLTLLCLFPPREGVRALFGGGRGYTPPESTYRGHAPFWAPPESSHARDEYAIVAASPTYLALEAAAVWALALFAAALTAAGTTRRGSRTTPPP